MNQPQQHGSCRLKVGSRVQSCLAQHGAVVALETAVFTHGLPADQAKSCFLELEEMVARHGVQSATCAVVAGTGVVGIDSADLTRLLAAEPDKATSATLASVMGLGRSAGTTAGATMMLAHRAGIRIVATGGIGGVHRGDGWDISGDLQCLARLPLVVVCSGMKSILHITRTVERLETLGVTILGYRTSELPVFYSASSGVSLPARAESPEDIAAVWRCAREISSPASVLVCNPPPPELALDPAVLDAAVSEALPVRCRGPEVTPAHLSRLQALLGDRAVRLNRALLGENAVLAARVARLIATGAPHSR